MSKCCPSNENLEFLLKCINKAFCSQVDSEISLMCTEEGVPVFVRLRFSTQLDTSTTVPVDAWNLDGSKYGGDITALVSCAAGGSTAAATVTRSTPTGSGTIIAGKLSISIVNIGSASGTVDGETLVANQAWNISVLEFENVSYTLPAVTYNATGTTFSITVMEA